MNDETKLQQAQAAYRRYIQLVDQLGQEEQEQLDAMIAKLEQKRIEEIHQTIDQL